MVLYAATIFVSAFLLFLVQPVMAKQILPWFGGSATVWTTCLVFFQSALLAGYAYADWTVREARAAALGAAARRAARREPRGAADRSRGALEAGRRREPVVAHPRHARGDDRAAVLPAVDDQPAGAVVVRAALPGASPYRLFALSNLASMLALVGYPFLLEPWAPTRAQALGWSAGYAAFDAALRRRRLARASDAGRRAVPERWQHAGAACRRRSPIRRRRSRRPPAGSSSGARSRRRRRSCCSRCRTTSRRTSRRCRCCGSCRSRSTS